MGAKLEDFRRRIAQAVRRLEPCAGVSQKDVSAAIEFAANVLALASTDDLKRFHRVGKMGARNALQNLSGLLSKAAIAIDSLPEDAQEALRAEIAKRAKARKQAGNFDILDSMPAGQLVLGTFIAELARASAAAPANLSDRAFGKWPRHFVRIMTDVAISLFERVEGKRATVTTHKETGQGSGRFFAFASALYAEFGMQANPKSELLAARARRRKPEKPVGDLPT